MQKTLCVFTPEIYALILHVTWIYTGLREKNKMQNKDLPIDLKNLTHTIVISQPVTHWHSSAVEIQ